MAQEVTLYRVCHPANEEMQLCTIPATEASDRYDFKQPGPVTGFSHNVPKDQMQFRCYGLTPEEAVEYFRARCETNREVSQAEADRWQQMGEAAAALLKEIGDGRTTEDPGA